MFNHTSALKLLLNKLLFFSELVEATSTSSTFRLTDLPVELLIEILKRARWRDILHLREVRRLIHST